jgi:hypothetical protein
MNDEPVPWEGRCIFAASDFAGRCAELKRTNPYRLRALECVMRDLATELWDRGLSQSEIRDAFTAAVDAHLIQYCAGEERRGDRERKE